MISPEEAVGILRECSQTQSQVEKCIYWGDNYWGEDDTFENTSPKGYAAFSRAFEIMTGRKPTKEELEAIVHGFNW